MTNCLPLTEYTILNYRYVELLFNIGGYIIKPSIEAIRILKLLDMPLSKLNIKIVKTLHAMGVAIDRDNIISCMALFNLEIAFTHENIESMRILSTP